MKDYRIAYMVAGHSEFDDTVWKILSKRYPSQKYFAGFDYLDLADCFILAGADVKTALKFGEPEIEMFIDEKDKPGFIRRLSLAINEKDASLRGRFMPDEGRRMGKG